MRRSTKGFRKTYARSYGNNSFRTRSVNGYSQYNTGSGWVFKHRRVAEKKLEGPIFRGNEVHHRNGIKTDNRPGNLVVLTKAAHRKMHKG